MPGMLKRIGSGLCAFALAFASFPAAALAEVVDTVVPSETPQVIYADSPYPTEAQSAPAQSGAAGSAASDFLPASSALLRAPGAGYATTVLARALAPQAAADKTYTVNNETALADALAEIRQGYDSTNNTKLISTAIINIGANFKLTESHEMTVVNGLNATGVRDVTMNLDGHTLTVEIPSSSTNTSAMGSFGLVVGDGTSLALNGGNIVVEGTATMSRSSAIAVSAGNNATGLTVSGTHITVEASTDASVRIGIQNNGGTVILTGDASIAHEARGSSIYNSGGTLTVQSGTYTHTVSYAGYCLQNAGGVVNLTGGSFSIPSRNNITESTGAVTVRNGIDGAPTSTYTMNVSGEVSIESENTRAPAFISSSHNVTFSASGGKAPSVVGVPCAVRIDGTGSNLSARFQAGEFTASTTNGTALLVTSASTVTGTLVNVSGGTFTGFEALRVGTADRAAAVVAATCNVSAGTFNGTLTVQANITTDNQARKHLVLSGGKYYDTLHSGSLRPSDAYRQQGCNTREVTAETPAYFEIFVDATTVAARISGTPYYTLEEAIAACGVGQTVVLARRNEIYSTIVIDGDDAPQNSERRVILNLNGYEIDADISGGNAFEVVNSAQLTIMNDYSATADVTTGNEVSGTTGVLNVLNGSTGVYLDSSGTLGMNVGTITVKAGTGGIGIHNKGGSYVSLGTKAAVTVEDSALTNQSQTEPLAIYTEPYAGTLSDGAADTTTKIAGGAYSSDNPDMAVLRFDGGVLTTTTATFNGTGKGIEVRGGTATLQTGTIIKPAKQSAQHLRALYVTDTVSAAEVYVKDGVTFQGEYAMYLHHDPSAPSAKRSRVWVAGGNFEGQLLDDYPTETSKYPGEGEKHFIELSGGYYSYYPKATRGAYPVPRSYIRYGYELARLGDGSANFVRINEDKIVCYIGNVPYVTVQDAVDAIPEGSKAGIAIKMAAGTVGTEIELVEPVVIQNRTVSFVMEGRHIAYTGKEASASASPENCAVYLGDAGVLKVSNSATTSVVGTIKARGSASGVYLNGAGARLEVRAGGISAEGANAGFAVHAQMGTVLIEGGQLSAPYAGASTRTDGLGPGCVYLAPGATAGATMTGGTLTSKSSTVPAFLMHGGTFGASGSASISGEYGAVHCHGGQLSIKAGRYSSNNNYGTALLMADDEALFGGSVEGGTFHGANAVLLRVENTVPKPSTLVVSEGVFEGKVGIQGDDAGTRSGILNIFGGTFYTTLRELGGFSPAAAYIGEGYRVAENDAYSRIVAMVIDPSNFTVRLVGFTTVRYNGTPQTPADSQIVVQSSGKTLTSGTDYTYSFAGDTTNAGVVTVNVMGRGKYTGLTSTTYTILPRELSLTTITLSDNGSYAYQPGGVRPGISSIFDSAIHDANGNNYQLIEGVDYKIDRLVGESSAGTGSVRLIGLGNYGGTASRTFTVTAKDLNSPSVSIEGITDAIFTGSPIEMASLSIRDSNADGSVNPTLQANADFTVSYQNNTNVSTADKKAVIIITGRGNYTGTVKREFTILPKDISGTDSGVLISDLPRTVAKDYTRSDGKRVPATFKVTYNNIELVEGVDYEIDTNKSTNTYPGTQAGALVIKGIGNFTGTAVQLYDVQAENQLSVRPIPDQTYTGQPIEIVDDSSGTAQNNGIVVLYSGEEVQAGADHANYEITYETADHTSIGYVIIRITIKRDVTVKSTTVHAGTTTYAGFRIVAKNARNIVVSDVANQTLVAKGTPVTPKVSVRDVFENNRILVEGRDYFLRYADNTDYGTAKVTVVFYDPASRPPFYGPYTGNSITKTFRIVRSIASASVTVDAIPVQWWTGAAIKPGVTIRDSAAGTGGTVLVPGIDYSVLYSGNINPGNGTGQVHISGMGDYAGSVRTEAFSIHAMLDQATISLDGGKPAAAYSVNSGVLVRLGSRTLVQQTDYALTVDNSSEENIVKVTATEMGGAAALYFGSKSQRFYVDPTTFQVTALDGTEDPGATDPGTSGGDNLVEVPNLRPLSEEQMRATLYELGLNLSVVREADPTVIIGGLISQFPVTGTRVQRGTTVEVRLSLGMDATSAVEQVTVPDVTGMTESGARYALRSRGFSVSRVNVPTSSITIGTVIGQSVAAGTQVGKGSLITIAVSVGVDATGSVETATVPDVTGKTAEEAVAALEAAGFKYWRTYASSGSVEKGKVIGQSVPGGSSVSLGASITVTISTGMGIVLPGSEVIPGGSGSGTGGTDVPGGTGFSGEVNPGDKNYNEDGTKKEPIATVPLPYDAGDTAYGTIYIYDNGYREVVLTRLDNGEPAQGWQIVGGEYYYAYSEGVALTGMLSYAGKIYLLDTNGNITTGFTYDPTTGDKLYFNPEHDGSYGAMQAGGWLQVAGDWYYAADNGTILTGKSQVKSDLYCFDYDGRLQVGWLYDEKTGERMWANDVSATDYGKITVNGWFKSGNYWYLTKRDGTIRVGWQTEPTSGRWFYFENTTDEKRGAMKTGWFKYGKDWYMLEAWGSHTGFLQWGNDWYYFSPTTGAEAYGWFLDNGQWYYANWDGKVYTGWLQWGSDWYLFSPYGPMYTGWWWEPSNASWYYFTWDGRMLRNAYTNDGFYVGWDGVYRG